ncbi:MAG: hypothetical protein U0931_30040 [Vulcanimicrobiota bacterium]
MKKTLVHICLALAATSLSAQAAPNGKEQVLFAAGKTSKSVSTTIQGQNVYDFLVTARAGQLLSVTQKAGSKAYFNVNSPGTELALFNGSIAGNQLKNRQLPDDGTYAVRVYLMGGASESKAAVTLDIAVTGKPLAPLSDKMDARVGKTPYHATASVPCKYSLDPKLTSCEAGVIRRGKDGTATVALKMKGFTRSILFVKGKPVASDSAEEMKSSKKGDLTTVTFGGTSEVYEIRDAFLMGE